MLTGSPFWGYKAENQTLHCTDIHQGTMRLLGPLPRSLARWRQEAWLLWACSLKAEQVGPTRLDVCALCSLRKGICSGVSGNLAPAQFSKYHLSGSTWKKGSFFEFAESHSLVLNQRLCSGCNTHEGYFRASQLRHHWSYPETLSRGLQICGLFINIRKKL